MRYVMGVDGGGTKTSAVITDETGKRVGSGLAGCGNHQTVGIAVALGNIRRAVESALADAQLQPNDMAFVQYGLAGADRDIDFRILQPALATLPFVKWQVVCDTMEGLRLGSPDHVGVVLVCGTGTNAAGRNRQGKMVQVGGFGWLYGDAAGGQYLAEQTFRVAIRAWEGRERPTCLEFLVAKQLGFATMGDLVHHHLNHGIQHIPATLTLSLHDAATAGDEVAIRILQNTGRELGISALAVIRQLGGFHDEKIRVVLVGSVLSKGRSTHLMVALRETVTQSFQDVEWVMPVLEPVYGSIMLAMDGLGIPVTPAMLRQFEEDRGGDR